MKMRIAKLAGGSALAAMLLAGCGAEEEEPMEEPAVEEPAMEEDMTEEEGDNDVLIEENDETEDQNTDEDMDPGTDENTPEEDVIEDQGDMEDADNQDS